MIPFLVYFSPLLLVSEVVQLVVAERFLGIKQIDRGRDPRHHGPSERVSRAWILAIGGNWLWMMAMLVSDFARGQVLCMIAVSLIGYGVRRNCGLKWVLVVLTLEGAIRIGMHVSLLTLVGRTMVG